MDIVNYIVENSTLFIEYGGIFVGFLLVFIECFIPILPLSVFVGLNVNAFGFIIGSIISWVATCLGSYICYKLFFFLGNKLSSKMLKRKKLNEFQIKICRFEKIKFTELVLIMTLPFTPSFLINILSGMSKINSRKFIGAILMGKFFTILFWGFISKSIIVSLTDISSIVCIIIMLIVVYILSKIISHKMKIE